MIGRRKEVTRRTALALCCVGFLGLPAFGADEPQEPACCRRKESKEKAGKLRCSLTDKEVDECCCVKTDDGKLHCTLADQDVEECCCSEVKAEGKVK